MVVVVFRSRQRAGLDQEATARGIRMYELASKMPGFLSYKDFAAPDGETVSIVEFDTHDHLRAWREHPEHLETQRWGRESFFTEYQIQVCDVVRVSRSAG